MKRPNKTPKSGGKAPPKRPGWMPDLPPRPAQKAARPGPAAGKARGPVHKAPQSKQDPQAQREAQRYEHPIPSREAILAFLSERAQLLNTETLAQDLGLTDPRDFEALTKRLAAMLRDGQLLQNRRGGYGVAQKLDLIPGTIIANAEGFGFLRPETAGDDIYISPAEMRKVMHGDRVLLSVVGVDRRGRKQGAIVEVLERRASRIVGRIVVDNGVVVVAPDDRRMHQDILIPPGKDRGARSGQIVVAEIIQPPTAQRGPIGEVVSVLGERLTPSLIVEMAIASHGLPQQWPEAALREAAQVEPQVTKDEIVGRADLRNLPLVTIDGEDARDFDDAVFAEPVSGGFRLIVAIADVSHYVRPGTGLDDEAQKRSTSVYFPGFVVPMLPETLSNGICSLNPKVERLCMVCEMQVGFDGEVTRSKFCTAVMRSHARLTYTRVWQALGENNADARAELADVMPQLEHLHQLYKLLAKARQRRGAIDFDKSRSEVPPGAVGRDRAAWRRSTQRCAQADRGMHDRGERGSRQIPRPAQDSRVVSRACHAAGIQVRRPAGIPARIRLPHATACGSQTGGFLRAVEENQQACGRGTHPVRAASFAIAGRVQPAEFRTLRPGAGCLSTFHLADPPLSRPARTPRHPLCADQGQARGLHIQRQRNDVPGHALLAERASRRRGRA